MAKMTEADIVCPFFTSETATKVNCEGLETGIGNTLRFPDEDRKQEYIGRYCSMYPNGCAICAAAERKYDERGLAIQ